MNQTEEIQKHNNQTLIYLCSVFFERASYYGFRAILVLYMIGETLKMSREEALYIYGSFTGAFLISKIIGALFGDLIIGNKKASLIGGIIQAFGAFFICIPSSTSLYVSLFLIVLGNGFYSPNLTALFGKNYLNKTKLLDSGFTLYYLSINVAATLGIAFIGYIGDNISWNYGFAMSGVLMLASTIFIYVSKESQDVDMTKINTSPMELRALKIIISIILVTLFWGVYELSSSNVYLLQNQLKVFLTAFAPEHLWSFLNPIFLISTSIIAVVLWTKFHTSQAMKLTLGFFFGALSFGVLMTIPEVPSGQDLTIYLIATVLLSISEICIAPIIFSVLTKYTNPKYLAIVISFTFVPTRVSSMLIGYFNDYFYNNPSIAMMASFVSMGIIGIALSIYILFIKRLIKQKS